jgi:hypothetical protein
MDGHSIGSFSRINSIPQENIAYTSRGIEFRYAPRNVYSESRLNSAKAIPPDRDFKSALNDLMKTENLSLPMAKRYLKKARRDLKRVENELHETESAPDPTEDVLFDKLISEPGVSKLFNDKIDDYLAPTTAHLLVAMAKKAYRSNLKGFSSMRIRNTLSRSFGKIQYSIGPFQLRLNLSRDDLPESTLGSLVVLGQQEVKKEAELLAYREKMRKKYAELEIEEEPQQKSWLKRAVAFLF